MTQQTNGDRVLVRFVPLPAERRAGYRAALEWFASMILAEVMAGSDSSVADPPAAGRQEMKENEFD
jgi:hypothetical protein